MNLQLLSGLPERTQGLRPGIPGPSGELGLRGITVEMMRTAISEVNPRRLMQVENKSHVMKPHSENNPIRHTQKIKVKMNQLIDHLREDVGKITEPKAQALFETSAEVLTGLVKAFDDYENKSEKAWRTEPMASRPKGRTTNAARR